MQNPFVRFSRAALTVCSEGVMGSRHRNAMVVPRHEGMWELDFYVMNSCHSAVSIEKGSSPLGQNGWPTSLLTPGLSNFNLLKEKLEPQDHQAGTI